MRKLITAASLAFAALLAPLAAVVAQGNAESQHFLLAVASAPLPGGERAVIVRTARGAQMDLVVLAPDGNAQHTLIGAVTLLRTLREKNPTPATTDVASMQYAEAVIDIPADRRGRLEAVLRQARQGEVRQLAEFGEVHAIVVNPRSLK